MPIGISQLQFQCCKRCASGRAISIWIDGVQYSGCMGTKPAAHKRSISIVWRSGHKRFELQPALPIKPGGPMQSRGGIHACADLIERNCEKGGGSAMLLRLFPAKRLPVQQQRTYSSCGLRAMKLMHSP
jgi:hypothetical protein